MMLLMPKLASQLFRDLNIALIKSLASLQSLGSIDGTLIHLPKVQLMRIVTT